MKKNEYMAPEMEVIKLQIKSHLLETSGSGDADIPVDDD